MEKKISEISLNDFTLHAIWSWVNGENESLVSPLESVEDEFNYDALFIASDFITNDGTLYQGFIGYRVVGSSVYLLSIANHKGEFKDLPLNKGLQDANLADAICMHLNKNKIEVFPIRYKSSPNQFKLLRGRISV